MTTPSAEPTPSPPAVRPTPNPRLPIPAGTPRCQTSQLEVAFISSSFATGHVLNSFEMRNRSKAACWVYGYVGFQRLDASGRPLPQSLVWTTDTFFLRFDPPTRILLSPGTAAMRSAEGMGHAFFNVEADDWTCPANEANATASLKIWPPDEYAAFIVPATNGTARFVSCHDLAVHPLQIQPLPSSG